MNSLLPQLRRLLVALFVTGLVWFAATDWWLTKPLNVLALVKDTLFLAVATAGVYFLLRRDIQKREQTHAKNHEARQTFETLTQAAPAGIFRANPQGDLLFVNHRWSALTGRSQAESQGFGWLLAVHPDDSKKVTEEWRKCVRGEKEFHLDFRVRNKDGSTRWVAAHALRHLDEHEQPDGIIGSIFDIHERKVADDRRLIEQASAIDDAITKAQQEASYRKEMAAELERRADELKKRDAEIESANRQLWAELSGREQVEAELTKTRDAVEQTLAERTASFTDIISALETLVAEHELAEQTVRTEKTELEKRASSATVELETLRHRLRDEGTRRELAEAEAQRTEAELSQRLDTEVGAREEAEKQLQRSAAETGRVTKALQAELATARTAQHDEAKRRELVEEAARRTEAELAQRLAAEVGAREQQAQQLQLATTEGDRSTKGWQAELTSARKAQHDETKRREQAEAELRRTKSELDRELADANLELLDIRSRLDDEVATRRQVEDVALQNAGSANQRLADRQAEVQTLQEQLRVESAQREQTEVELRQTRAALEQ